jgi:hypothetical protein
MNRRRLWVIASAVAVAIYEAFVGRVALLIARAPLPVYFAFVAVLAAMGLFVLYRCRKEARRGKE